MKTKLLLTIILSISVLFNLYLFNQDRILNYQNKKLLDTLSISETINDIPLTTSNVKTYLKRYNIKFPDIVYSQIMLESGNLHSYLTIHNHNLLGIKYATNRPTTAIGEKDGYAYYENWVDCILDMKYLQKCLFKGKTEEDYLIWLVKIYSHESDYITRLHLTNK